MDRSSIVWLALDGLTEFAPSDTLPRDFGAKALGLLWMPSAWVPPFFVISPSIFAEYKKQPAEGRLRFLESRVGALLDEAKARSKIASDASLMLRSNAVRETVAERGRYASVYTLAAATIKTLEELYARIESVHSNCELGIVVQQAIHAIVKGHLSNLRRVAEEYRDALVELENSAGFITGRRISYRRWRAGRPPTLAPLICRSADDIPNCLRPILAFATQHRQRALFEWVWDGQFVHVVQADVVVQDSLSGVSPDAPMRGQIYATIEATDLSCFVPVQARSGSSVGKLRNHAIYAEHGFWQPTFYELSNRDVLAAIVGGRESAALEHDLRVLTQRPLVIRTSCSSHVHLLPRSDELATAEAAKGWLYGQFASQMREKKLALDSISLLAHHYVPARVAAFSMGSESRLEVQVASLWGIPEGLYYYPFDSHTIHTLGTKPEEITPADHSRFKVLKKVRYKSHFVAPDADGQFVRHETAAPWDWKDTIADEQILAKIAAFTRLLAQKEKYAVNLMWLLGCEATSGTIDAVPWYHEEFEAVAEGIAFQRNARDEELIISTEQDLLALERRAHVAGASPTTAPRLVVRLFPAEDHAIRSESFAKRVGEAARSLDAIVVLSGATLSHMFYVLSRTGAHVSVQDRADMMPRAEVHEKLVRDRIPETVAATGEIARVATLTKEQVVAALRSKLVEEAFEVRDANREELTGELADVLEVVRGISRTTGIGFAAIERARKKKESRRGAFKDGIVLLETGGGSPPVDDQASPLIDLPQAESSRVVRAALPPLETVRMGPVDVRDAPEFVEHVQSATVPLTHPEWTVESPLSSELPEGFAAETISWSIDGKRNGTNLQLRIKIRIGTTQMELPLQHDRLKSD